LRQFKVALEKLSLAGPMTLDDVKICLDELLASYETLQNNPDNGSETEMTRWKELLGFQIKKHNNDLKFLAPWLFLPPAPDRFKNVFVLNNILTLRELSQMDVSLESVINYPGTGYNSIAENEWFASFHAALTEAAKRATERIAMLENLAQQCNDLANMELEFLYNRATHLLTIGYSVEEHRADPSYYDLLASEARLSTFVGISQGKLPQESWFSLGRLLTNAGGRPILL